MVSKQAMAERPILAIDLGATNLRCAVVEPSGLILRRRSVPTPFDDRVGDAIASLAAEVRQGAEVSHCVIGVPGRVDYEREQLEWGGSQPPSWKEILSARRLTESLGVRVELTNDADLAAVGEAYFGAGDPSHDVVYLTISTGVGAGAVLGGRLLRTRVSVLEIGLTSVGTSEAGTDDRFGARVLEDLASGTALREAAARAGVELDTPAILERAESGDPISRAIWKDACSAAALAAVNLAHILVPDIIVLGGGVSQAGEVLRSAVEDAVVTRGPQGLPSPISIRLAALGDNAGLVGAAAWNRAGGAGVSGAAMLTTKRTTPSGADTVVWSDALGIPEAIERTLAETEALAAMASFLGENRVHRIIASGNGASYYVALALSLASWASGAGPEVVAVPAGLLVSSRFSWRPGDVLLAFSSSGELKDLIEAPAILETGRFAAITSAPGSTLGRAAAVTAVVGSLGQRSLTHTQSFCGAVVAALAVWAQLTCDTLLLDALAASPSAARSALDEAWRWVDGLELEAVPTSAVVAGSGIAWAASLEAALLLKELSGIASEGVESREGATSAMVGLSQRSLVVSIQTTHDPHLVGTEASCASMGARLVRVPAAPESDQRLTPVSSFPYALALALRLAELSGRDADSPDWASVYLSAVRSGA